MESIVIFLIVLIVGYISTNFIFKKIQMRYYIPSGVEYIFLGIIIGPAFAHWINTTFEINYPQIITSEVLTQLNPAIATGIGFIGFIYGLKFKFNQISKAEPEDWRVALFELLVSLVIIGLVSFGIFYYFFYNGTNLREIILSSYVLSVIGALSSNFLISSLIKIHKVSGGVSQTISNSSLINSNLMIFIFGMVFAFLHIGATESVQFTVIEWIVISIVLALLIGFLFFIFIGRETDENKLFVAVLGIVIFSSGIAYYLNFSPLFMNFVLGTTLANLSKISEKIESSLERLFQPLNILVVVMAGFIWQPPSLGIFLFSVCAFIIFRYAAKMTAGYISFQSAFAKEKLTPGLGRGLMPLDIVACAMIIDYVNVYNNQFTPIVVSAVLSGVIFFNIIGYPMAKNLLVDVGEITKEDS